jgi:hypothetical protein
MMVISFSSLLEEAAADPSTKYLAGNIKAFEKLFDPDIVERLEASHSGIFAFMAFHPTADAAVVDYLKGDTLADDSGPNILCLFTLQVEARAPTVIESDTWESVIEVTGASNPSAKMIRDMFAPEEPPPLPGIVFFPDFSSYNRAVYVPLDKLEDTRQVREHLRNAFMIASAAAQQSLDQGRSVAEFSDNFAAMLKSRRIRYNRTGRRSMREWLIAAYQTAWDHRSDIVTAVGLLPGL